jgi:hypothetical protein
MAKSAALKPEQVPADSETTLKVLTCLRAQLASLDATIAAIERLGSHAPRKIGRPPKWMAQAKNTGSANKTGAKRAAKKSG